MDWSLVLASQGIEVVIDKGESGWVLILDEADLVRARAAIHQYQIENRAWRWQQEIPGTDFHFHWGAAVWAFGMAAFYYWSMVRFPGLKSAGMVNSHAVFAGQWWRLFTAVTLHENLGHLAGNMVTGFLLLGLVMGRFGPGVAMLAAFLAGMVGNWAAVLLDPLGHYSLGASGMVTGALGLVTMQSFHRMLPRGLAAGVLILVLIGFAPETDVIAHVGGFVAGVIFGFGLNWFRPAALQRVAPNLICGLLLAVLVLATWRLAAQP
jgi:membrane associated rhomboid family serine protease